MPLRTISGQTGKTRYMCIVGLAVGLLAGLSFWPFRRRVAIVFTFALRDRQDTPICLLYILDFRSGCKIYGNWYLFCTFNTCSTTCRMWSSTIDWDSLLLILSHFRIWKQLYKNIFLYNCFQIIKWNKITPIELHRSLFYIIQYT